MVWAGGHCRYAAYAFVDESVLDSKAKYREYAVLPVKCPGSQTSTVPILLSALSITFSGGNIFFIALSNEEKDRFYWGKKKRAERQYKAVSFMQAAKSQRRLKIDLK